jgi:hypothetical protein
MRTCRFNELLVISQEERAAQRIQFDPGTTVVVGSNDTGKSSLLKTLYATFGADAAIAHPKWKEARITSVVRFSFEKHQYAMLRHGRMFGFFDGNGNLIRHFNRIGSELAPFLAELFGFQLTLTARDGASIVPPPAYLFLPFYIDQDASWTKNWAAFDGLAQLSNWKRSLVEYHVGIRTDEYYRLRGDEDRAKRDLDEKQVARKGLIGARDRVEERLSPSTFALDVSAFKDEIEQLLVDCNELAIAEERYKTRLGELRTSKLVLEQQINIAGAAIKEAAADYKYATLQLGEEIECPTCGNMYENHFADRFRIAVDEDRLKDLRLQLQDELLKIADEIQKEVGGLDETRHRLARLRETLAVQKEDIKLSDVIESQGRQEVKRVFREGLKDYAFEIKELEDRQKAIHGRLRELDDKAHEESILAHYRELMRQYLALVDVKTIRERDYQSISGRVAETGSDLPRALMAYYYAILQTMMQYSTTAQFPIVIDSPNQQAQDKTSLPLLLRFIVEQRPAASQLILAVEEPLEVPHGGTVLTLDRKLKVLDEEMYPDVQKEVGPMIDALVLASSLPS